MTSAGDTTTGTARPPQRRALGLRLIAAAQDEQRTRRPTDAVVAIVATLTVVIAGLASRLVAELEQSVAGVVGDVPGFFDTLWRFMFWTPVASSLVFPGDLGLLLP